MDWLIEKKRRFLLLIIGLLAPMALSARAFTVLVYNVENLFDIDGVALFGDYDPVSGSDYGAGHVLNKLESIRTTLAAFNDGRGPEVILFQEFELDRTPFGTPDAHTFLARNKDRDLARILAEEPSASRLPAELLLLKYLEDHGMGGYAIAQPDPMRMETHPPHKNVVFSRFPVKEVRQRPMLSARDLLVAVLDVDGHELMVLNNHWKSGASNHETEPTRIQNAYVVRAEVEAILHENPRAELLIGGDLNCYYNHKAAFPELEKTAVNDVLGANGFENRMTRDGSRNLYNLWFELPFEKRGSEVWRGMWGTLMQLIVTPGLYDQQGIQYVDNSFDRLVLPGENTDTRWGRPRAWSNFGGGSGFSDHLPIYARFRVLTEPAEGEWMALENPTNEEMSPARPGVNFARMDRRALPDIATLAPLTDQERARYMGEVFAIDLPVASVDPVRIQVGDLSLQVWSPLREVRDRLNALQPGDRLRTLADLDYWRGNVQVVVRHPTWLR